MKTVWYMGLVLVLGGILGLSLADSNAGVVYTLDHDQMLATSGRTPCCSQYLRITQTDWCDTGELSSCIQSEWPIYCPHGCYSSCTEVEGWTTTQWPLGIKPRGYFVETLCSDHGSTYNQQACTIGWGCDCDGVVWHSGYSCDSRDVSRWQGC
jgi:hypothetical protein